jgi:hypothetical protein
MNELEHRCPEECPALSLSIYKDICIYPMEIKLITDSTKAIQKTIMQKGKKKCKQ